MPTSKTTRTRKPATSASASKALKPVARTSATTTRPVKPSGPVKAFDFVVTQSPRVLDDVPFTLGDVDAEGELVHYYVRGDAKKSALGVISAQFIQAEANNDDAGQAVGTLEMLTNLFTDDSSRRLLSRMKDPKDPFGEDQLAEVVEWAVEVVTNRPTTP